MFIHDVPGFFIGRDGERKRIARKIITWMDALGMATVPRVSIVLAGCPKI
jgi:acetyl-CoA carboxylase carboxyltransferase component